jgi:hypothetical protein
MGIDTTAIVTATGVRPAAAVVVDIEVTIEAIGSL